MSNPKRYTITSALPYANGPVHIGHLAGAYIPADIYVRYLRMRYGKENVLFVCGSDEHGVPITLKARKEGVSPQEIVDRYHNIIKKSFAEFGISFDIYHRTSDPLHHETAAEFFKQLHAEDVFIKKESEQYFDEEANQFLADRYITGTCPNCKNPNAYGDQCEKCGSSLSPLELINPASTLSGSKPVRKKTTHWYLPLDKMQSEWLGDWILNESERPETWKKHVLGQCKSWLDTGLHPRAVTRDLSWGVQVPVENADDKVLYVWFDAPIGYISATKAWAKENGQDWKPWWQDEGSKLVHFIGKDNIVFHCIIFPAMLKAQGDYILPTNVPANQFLNLEGEKMSTSRGWTVWLNEYLERFPDMEYALRYALIANMPENKDSDFSWKELQERNNNELVANVGNFINRVAVLSHKYFDGKVQSLENLEAADQTLLAAVADTYESVAQKLERYEFKAALQDVLAFSSMGNKYLADTEPWKKVKTDEARTGQILAVATQLFGHLGFLLEPFLPKSAAKIRAMLSLELEENVWQRETIIVPSGSAMASPELLFRKIEDEEVSSELARLEAVRAAKVAAAASEQKHVPVKPLIQFEDFTKLDLRVGTITEASKVPKANKLLQLQVDLGFEMRTIVSGIAEQFSPEDVLGKQVSVVVNLAPRKIRGVESQGMILFAEEADGTLRFLNPNESSGNGICIA